MEFDDPVLQTFNVTLPKVWQGSLSILGSELNVDFNPLLELEIPRLAQLGVGRSSFQKLASIRVNTQVSVTVLKESGAGFRETWIEAVLMDGQRIAITAGEKVQKYTAFDSSSSCPPNDQNNANWYVYRRSRDGICVVHEGEMIIGGQIAYEYKFGPNTKDACDNYYNTNCGDDMC